MNRLKIISSCTLRLINISPTLSFSLHLSLSLHPPCPGRYIADPPHPFLKPFCTLFALPSLLLSPSPSGTSQVKSVGCLFFFLSTCSLVHSLTLSPAFPVHPPVSPFLRLLTLLRSARLTPPASSFNVPHTLPLILRHTLQLVGHPVLRLLYLSLL